MVGVVGAGGGTSRIDTVLPDRGLIGGWGLGFLGIGLTTGTVLGSFPVSGSTFWGGVGSISSLGSFPVSGSTFGGGIGSSSSFDTAFSGFLGGSGLRGGEGRPAGSGGRLSSDPMGILSSSFVGFLGGRGLDGFFGVSGDTLGLFLTPVSFSSSGFTFVADRGLGLRGVVGR